MKISNNKSETSHADFNDKVSKKVSEILDFAINNKYSDFYKSKYGSLSNSKITSYEQFKEIPFLEKDDFLKVKLAKRIFVPKDSVDRYTFSSGTSQRNRLTVLPQYSSFNPMHQSPSKLEYGEILLKEIGISKLLILWPIASSAFLRNMTLARDGIIKIPGDTYNLSYSAALVRNLEIEAFTTTATILNFFIQHLKNANVNLSSIKWIALGGEYCSELKLSYFKEIFPNAFFSFRYGSSETGARGYKCKYLNQENPNIFHSSHHLFLETIDCDSEGFGELIVTTLTKRPFPLIRYKTGDIVSISKHECACGNNCIINVGGRKELDILKISGVTLHTKAIEVAINAAKEFINPQFQMHVFERKINNVIKIQLEIYVTLKSAYVKIKDNSHFMENLSALLAKNLQVSQKSFLTDLIEQGIFYPLIVKILSPADAHFKSRNIISHIN